MIFINDFNLYNNERIKEIENYPGYYITSYGRVFSFIRGNKKEIAIIEGANNYLYVHIKNDNGQFKNVSLHRLVAKHFIPNELNYPEVNHKDKNRKNCNVDNLEWCTRKENLRQSYSTLSPVRNHISCVLYKGDKKVGSFQSITEACRYSVKYFKAKYSSLNKYLSYDDLKIVAIKNQKVTQFNSRNIRNRNSIKIYKDGYFVKKCSTFDEASTFLANIGYVINRRNLNTLVLSKKANFGCYEVKRSD